MLRTTAVDSSPPGSRWFPPAPCRVWARGFRAFGSMLARLRKTWMRLERDVVEPRSTDDGDLHDIRINPGCDPC
jgi:hypothetical protein